MSNRFIKKQRQLITLFQTESKRPRTAIQQNNVDHGNNKESFDRTSGSVTAVETCGGNVTAALKPKLPTSMSYTVSAWIRALHRNISDLFLYSRNPIF